MQIMNVCDKSSENFTPKFSQKQSKKIKSPKNNVDSGGEEKKLKLEEV